MPAGEVSKSKLECVNDILKRDVVIWPIAMKDQAIIRLRKGIVL